MCDVAATLDGEVVCVMWQQPWMMRWHVSCGMWSPLEVALVLLWSISLESSLVFKCGLV